MYSFNETFEFGSNLGSEARWIGFWLDELDLGLTWLDHGSIAQISTQWLKSWLSCSKAQILNVLARLLEISTQWLDCLAWSRLIKISKQKIDPPVFPFFFFFFFFQILNLNLNLNFIFYFIYIYFLNMAIKRK